MLIVLIIIGLAVAAAVAFLAAKHRREVPPGPSIYSRPPAPAAPASVADELSELAGLRDRGVLSQEEFEAEKLKLLGARS